MSTRATLYVPSPETSMSLGTAWASSSWNGDGFCVSTEGRVWLDANGDSTSSSTLTILSNGSGSDGQLLLQSLRSSLYVFGSNDTYVTSNESVLLAGGDGVRILAGHGDTYGFSMPWGAYWSIVRDETLDDVEPDDADPSSDHASAYVARMDTVAEYWGLASAAYGPTAAISEIVRVAFGARGAGSSATTAMIVSAVAAAATMVGGAIEMTKLGADEVPGLQVHAYGAVNLATTGFATVSAGAGLHFVAGWSNMFFGFLESGGFGGLSAQLKSIKQFDVSGSRVELSAGLSATYASNLFSMKTYGLAMQIGAPIPTWPTQVPTTQVDVEGLIVDAMVTGGKIDVLAGGKVSVIAGQKAVLTSATEVVLSSPAYEVKVSAMGITITVLATTKIQMDDMTGVTFDNATMKTALPTAPPGVVISDKAGACGLFVDATGVKLKGPLVTLGG